jgi:hypothetical protein
MSSGKLRIAWSVFCALVAALLIALWISSYGLRTYPILSSFSIELDKYFFVLLLPGGI